MAEAEHGPSEKAVEAARAEYQRAMALGLGRLNQATDAFESAMRVAFDPALGLDRSVCLRDVIDTIWNETGATYSEGERHRLIGRVERAFTESSSPDREGAE